MALLWPACGPDLENMSGPPKCHHSTLHVGQTIIPHVPDVECSPGAAQSVAYCSKCVHLDGLNAENTFHSSLYSV